MPSRTWIVVIPLTLTVANCASLDHAPASAQTAPAAAGAPANLRGTSAMASYVWHDGEQEHRVWMNPSLVAEFGSGTGRSPALGQATLQAEGRSGGQVVRYWKVEEGGTADRTLRQLTAEPKLGRYSPVLHDSPSPDGPVRILPGNIVVLLDASWDKDAVARWVERRQLRVVAELSFGPNMLLVETEPGLPALELANTLYRSGEVRAAFPDWLTQKTLK